jgi:hypothetical protein
MVVKTKNWSSYNQALKRRGQIDFWISEDAIKSWYADNTGKIGGQYKYSDLAIESMLTFKHVFGQALRQLQGFIESIFRLMKTNLDIPDYSTISKRGKSLNISEDVKHSDADGFTLIIDSTGLKIYGAGEWSETKHGLKKRRQWRKLHLGIDADTLEIVTSSLTTNKIGDPTEALNLLTKVDNPIDELLADGAYDSDKIYKNIENRDDTSDHKVTIPPHCDAVLSSDSRDNPTQRDIHIELIEKDGRKSWEYRKQYYRRLLVENTMGRYKQIIGGRLSSIVFENQINEAQIACKILNKMIRQGTPLRPGFSEM